MSHLRPYIPSTALCLFYDPLSPLRPFVPSTALCPLFSPLSPQLLYVPSTALYPLNLFSPLSNLQLFAPSVALYPLYGPCFLKSLLYHRRPSRYSVLCTALTILCPTYDPHDTLYPLCPSVTSMNLSQLYGLFLSPSSVLCRFYDPSVLSIVLCPLYTVEKAQRNYLTPMKINTYMYV
jgi:hypothetical protein